MASRVKINSLHSLSITKCDSMKYNDVIISGNGKRGLLEAKTAEERELLNANELEKRELLDGLNLIAEKLRSRSEQDRFPDARTFDDESVDAADDIDSAIKQDLTSSESKDDVEGESRPYRADADSETSRLLRRLVSSIVFVLQCERAVTMQSWAMPHRALWRFWGLCWLLPKSIS